MSGLDPIKMKIFQIENNDPLLSRAQYSKTKLESENTSDINPIGNFHIISAIFYLNFNYRWMVNGQHRTSEPSAYPLL